MEFKVIFFVTAVFLLGGARASIFTLGSHYREKTNNPRLRKGSSSACSGNLIRAFKASRDSNILEVACNGTRTNDPLASFKLIRRGPRGTMQKCIQLTWEGEEYALKVINGNNTVFERQQCRNASNDFLFKENPVNGSYHIYSYEHSDSGMYLTCSCDRDRLTLIQSDNRHERKIRFIRERHK